MSTSHHSQGEGLDRADSLAAGERQAARVVLNCSVVESSGIPEATLQEIGTLNVVGLAAPTATGRACIAYAAHRRSGRAGALLQLDGLECSSDTGIEMAADGNLVGEGDSLFVDHVDVLDGPRTTALKRLISRTAREGGALFLGAPLISDFASVETDAVIEASPLRERREAIPRLVRAWFEQRRVNQDPAGDVVELLAQHDWPGDVEEFEYVLRQLVSRTEGKQITTADVLPLLSQGAAQPEVGRTLADIEREHIYRVLDQFGWNRTKSAQSLGIDVKTLYNKLKRYEAASSLDG